MALNIKQTAVAGTMESSDVMVTVKPAEGQGLVIHLQSNVLTTFGDQIRAAVEEVFADFGIRDAEVFLVDKGAIDCVIRARVQAAICRASGEGFNWKGEDK
jgi:citrate lyase subunit gamma (acyl carrier protein)